MPESAFDILVVGAGHAGCEAASAAARLGARTALLTISARRIAQMSCNPAIGGLAKGQIVREIDALGGLMARVADSTALQYRLLNRSKGPAVRSPRAQCDRPAYVRAMRDALARHTNLAVLEETVTDLLLERGRVAGVRCAGGNVYRARAVVLTTGTFLRGILHRGDKMWPGGRIDEPAADRLSDALERAGLRLGRLKTGTPPRVDGRTLDYARLAEQPSDPDPVRFSFSSPRRREAWPPRPPGELAPPVPPAPPAPLGLGLGLGPLSCWITWTTPEVHQAIRSSLDRAPLYTGQIRSTGPRYCPSIEVKIVRFPDRPRHQVFLEPEGRATDEVYCNGIATSLPEDVQDRIVHAIPGMERARVLRYGYAIEYDFVPPLQTQATLESKIVPGLYLAGQINGTSGYEEAAGQGILAGINAARALASKPPVVLRRDQAYLGVLVDDLVTKGADEPYRMFTSLAEYRLLLRHDNADRRLMPLGREVGLVADDAWVTLQEKERQIRAAQDVLRRVRRGGRTLEEVLRRPEVTWDTLVAEVPDLESLRLSPEAREQVEIEAKYAGYLERQEREVQRARRMEDRAIPPALDYAAVPHLRAEAREKLARIRPRSLGQAARIAGIGPADLAVLTIHLARR